MTSIAQPIPVCVINTSNALHIRNHVSMLEISMQRSDIILFWSWKTKVYLFASSVDRWQFKPKTDIMSNQNLLHTEYSTGTVAIFVQLTMLLCHTPAKLNWGETWDQPTKHSCDLLARRIHPSAQVSVLTSASVAVHRSGTGGVTADAAGL